MKRYIRYFTTTGRIALCHLAITTAAWAENAGADSGPIGNKTNIGLQIIDQPQAVFGVGGLIDGLEARVSSVDDGHIGYPDLRHSRFNVLYQVPKPATPPRYFRQQSVVSDWSYTEPKASGDMAFTMQKNNLHQDVYGAGTLHIKQYDSNGTVIQSWSAEGTVPLTPAVPPDASAKIYLPGTYWDNEIRTIFPGTTHTSADGTDVQDVYCATPNNLNYDGLLPLFLGSDMIDPLVTSVDGVQIPPAFGLPDAIKQWTDSLIVIQSTTPRYLTGTLNYRLELSDEDTLANVQSRIDADQQATVLSSVPWSVYRSRIDGGAAGTDSPLGLTSSELWLYRYHVDFETYGDFYEEHGQVRFNVPAALQIPGVEYRGRVLEYFYPDTADFPYAVKIHEAHLKQGHWISDEITPETPTEDGFTILSFFTLTAEPINSHPILSLPSPDPTQDSVPPEYVGKRPTISSQDLISAGVGTRNVLTGSATLQQINLADPRSTISHLSYYFPDITATWSILDGATAQVRLWHWKDDGSDLGQWSLVGANENLAPYFGSSTDYFFAETLTPGRATLRITMSIGGQAVHDDIEIKTATAELAVDANRDGTITPSSQDHSDQTSPTQPYRFWINDDNDAGDTDGDDIPNRPNNGWANRVSSANYVTQDSGSQAGWGVVDGARDLTDFFPVYIDVQRLLTALPPSGSVKYKLKQADGAVNFVYTNLTRDHAFDYQRPPSNGPLTTGFGPQLDTAPGSALTRQITADGVDLFDVSPGFLAQLQQGPGVILIEGRAISSAPLVLSVENNDNGAIIAEVKLYLSFSGVESMYRHLNLRSGPDAPLDDQLAGNISRRNDDTDLPTNLVNPQKYPDTISSQPWFIFVDGSNVGGQSSRGWESETFKRLYWSRDSSGNPFKGRFLGVSWFGDPYATGLESVYDYHMSVRNAFATASKLRDRVNALPGRKTITGHSLGCGLIAAAIADYGMTVDHTCFVDAALPREAFDDRSAGDETNTSGVTAAVGMTPTVWRGYDARFYAANWNERFAGLVGSDGQADKRFTNLTWRKRFSNAAGTITNFYSSTEDVLGRYDDAVPYTSIGALINDKWGFSSLYSHVWVYQEKAKGDRHDYSFPLLGGSHAGSTYGGWGVNLKDPVSSDDPVYWNWDSTLHIRVSKSSQEIGSVDDATLGRDPVFEPGWGVAGGQQRQSPVSNKSPVNLAPSWIYDLYGTSGGTIAADYAKRAQLLAEFVPALSLPVGSRKTNAFGERNFDDPAKFAAPGWPRGADLNTKTALWWHSDMREVAYLYQSKFWDALVSVSQ
jgi:hypothetical protein